MKPITAWAVVTKRGSYIVDGSRGCPRIFRTKKQAEEWAYEFEGEKVVKVRIEVVE